MQLISELGMSLRRPSALPAALLALCCAVAMNVARAQGADAAVGEVVFAQGISTAQQAGAAPRFLTKGDALRQGDVISTSPKGYAVIGLRDGAKMTLRPNTVFAVEKFAHDAGEESAIMRLFKGGLRTVTGLIGKRNPGGVQLATPTATIGIRGTDFNARLCGADCRQEAGQVAQATSAGPAGPGGSIPTVARVASVTGRVTAVAATPGAPARTLTEGAPLFAGDTVRTEGGAYAQLGFRDESRVTLHAQTVFRIESFQDTGAGEGMLLRLLRGGMRAVTGLIGKRNPASVKYATSVATIGIRGSGAAIHCAGRCADPSIGGPPSALPGEGDGMFVNNFEGQLYAEINGRQFPIELNQTAFVDPVTRAFNLLAQMPDFLRNTTPFQDNRPIDFKNLFGAKGSGDDADLIVSVNEEGHVVIQADGQRIDLGPMESGGLKSGEVARFEGIPRIVRDDPYFSVSPVLFTGTDSKMTRFLGIGVGKPGQDQCEF